VHKIEIMSRHDHNRGSCGHHSHKPAAAVEHPVVAQGTIWTCPMHPQIRWDHPGNCPICGMALEPLAPSFEGAANPELIDMTRRFWASVVLSLPILIVAMGPELGLMLLPMRTAMWAQLALATPVVLWGVWPFF